MTWTYSGDPSSTDRDAVRFLIGDTDTTDQQLTDEEIAYLLDQAGDNVYAAAIAAAEALLGKYARLVDKNVGDLKLSYSQRQSSYAGLIIVLKKKFGIRSATPYAGGLSINEKISDSEDTDLTQPTFSRDQFNYPMNQTSQVRNDANYDET